MKNAVIFFARLPDENIHGKTRIGKEIKNQNVANGIAKALIIDSINEYQPLINDNYDIIWYHTGNTSSFSFDQWNIAIERKQKTENLGLSMKTIHSEILQSYKKAIIVGSDLPLINHQYIQKAFRRLDDHDVVIGPTEDYGYGLVGMNVFFDIYSTIKNWESHSSNYNLLKETKNILKQHQLQFSYLDTVFDIDYLSDIHKLWQIYLHTPQKIKHLKTTLQYLEEHKATLNLT